MQAPTSTGRTAASTSFFFIAWTAYLAVVVVVMHPAVLLLLRSPQFRIVDLLLPLVKSLFSLTICWE